MSDLLDQGGVLEPAGTAGGVAAGPGVDRQAGEGQAAPAPDRPAGTVEADPAGGRPDGAAAGPDDGGGVSIAGLMAEGLSVKQAAFVAAFLDNGFNATRAALAAGYSETGPAEAGYRLLRTPAVAEVIERELGRRGLTPFACKVLLAEVAFDSNITDFEPWLTGKKTLAELQAAGVNTALVKSARISEKGARSLELYDRLEAVREIGKVLGLVTEKHKVSIDGGLGLDLAGLPEDELRRLAETTEAPLPEVMP